MCLVAYNLYIVWNTCTVKYCQVLVHNLEHIHCKILSSIGTCSGKYSVKWQALIKWDSENWDCGTQSYIRCNIHCDTIVTYSGKWQGHFFFPSDTGLNPFFIFRHWLKSIFFSRQWFKSIFFLQAIYHAILDKVEEKEKEVKSLWVL